MRAPAAVYVVSTYSACPALHTSVCFCEDQETLSNRDMQTNDLLMYSTHTTSVRAGLNKLASGC